MNPALWLLSGQEIGLQARRNALIWVPDRLAANLRRPHAVQCELLDVHQLGFEQQCRVRGNLRAGAALAVGLVGRDRELALAADFHAGDSIIPTLDNIAGSELERQRLATLTGAVELRAVLQRTGVVDEHRAAGLRLGARTHNDVLALGARGQLHHFGTSRSSSRSCRG
jgi:hypothetical protein